MGYVIGGREHMIELVKMEPIFKWSTPTNINEFIRIFWEEHSTLES
jgi:hypothetical protein